MTLLTLIRRLLFAPKPSPTGPWIGEVWLEWEVCLGSTIYRDRFDTASDAQVSAKAAARRMDWHLPRTENFGIKWGVRRATSHPGDSHRIFSPYMPGSRRCSGEHRMAHPLNQQ